MAYRLQSVFLKGRPFEKIIETAKEEQVGLVAMGSHGRTGFARLFMGSVTERVIGTVGCPVLVVKMRPDRRTQRTMSCVGQVRQISRSIQVLLYQALIKVSKSSGGL